jgi:hypothetical protein
MIPKRTGIFFTKYNATILRTGNREASTVAVIAVTSYNMFCRYRVIPFLT